MINAQDAALPQKQRIIFSSNVLMLKQISRVSGVSNLIINNPNSTVAEKIEACLQILVALEVMEE